MKRIITCLPALALLSLGACAATPEEMAQLHATLNGIGVAAQQQQANFTAISQAQAAGLAATQQGNKGWYQKDASGTTVYCQQVGSTILCH